ncbi:MAG: hypothetical protein ACRYF7_08640 [Janthinobacterium lividum]
MTEGDSDVRYFNFANGLYHARHGKNLIGSDLSIFSSGSGIMGGVDGILRELPPLRSIIDTDKDQNFTSLFEVAALFDDDYAGRNGASVLRRNWRLREGKDFFLLHRNWPMKTREQNVLEKSFSLPKPDLYTELEDLLDTRFVDTFADSFPGALNKAKTSSNGERHCNFPDHVKSHLWPYTKDYAMVDDVVGLIDCLKAMRYYFGLTPEGI